MTDPRELPMPEPVYDVFVSYRWTEPDQSWVRGALVPALELSGLSVCLDVHHFRPGIDEVLEMARALRESRRGLCVLSPEYFDGNRNTLLEALGFVHLDPAALEGRLIPLLLRTTVLPDWLSHRVWVDWRQPEAVPREWRKLLTALGARELAAPPPLPPRTPTAPAVSSGTAAAGGAAGKRRPAGPRLWEGPGIDTRESVFDAPEPRPGQEFALELLTEPVLLRRDRRGVTLSVNRNRVRQAIYSTEGKRELCRQALDSEEKLAAARRLDDEIHRFLLGRSAATELVLPLDDRPLRWASGGVFSVVRWRGRRWTPFFFRDIAPYGWNISLGGSEKGDDLSDPWTFLMREFLEETLVLDGEPRPARPLHFKRFILPKHDIREEMRKAEEFAAQHLAARRRSDSLLIRPVATERLEELDPGICTVLHPLPVEAAVEVERPGGTTRRTPSLLVAVNLLELGIEVVMVAEYTLEDGDYLLDGELLNLVSGQELVRMPMALIAHDYLAAAFAGQELRYVGTTEPSVEGPPIPEADIHLFPFDARRRWEIVHGLEPRATDWERGRYGAWMERFGESFFTAGGEVATAPACPLFTPTSAKIVSYFFDRRSRS